MIPQLIYPKCYKYFQNTRVPLKTKDSLNTTVYYNNSLQNMAIETEIKGDTREQDLHQ